MVNGQQCFRTTNTKPAHTTRGERHKTNKSDHSNRYVDPNQAAKNPNQMLRHFGLAAAGAALKNLRNHGDSATTTRAHGPAQGSPDNRDRATLPRTINSHTELLKRRQKMSNQLNLPSEKSITTMSFSIAWINKETNRFASVQFKASEPWSRGPQSLHGRS